MKKKFIAPVIDVSRLNESATLAALDQAASDSGIAILENHGIKQHVTTQLLSAANDFFASPPKRKLASARTLENPWGFNNAELTKNTKDWKEIFDYSEPDDTEPGVPLPTDQPQLKTTLQGYFGACESLAFQLLHAFARVLKTPAADLEQAFRPTHTSFLRLNYYPTCPEPALPRGLNTPDQGHLGVNHHTDSGAFTFLLQDDNAGLELFYDEAWHLLPTTPGTLILNLGDVMQVWSNDRFKAPIHRVRANFSNPRLSAPYFFNPSYSANYAPLESEVSPSKPAKYQSINWGEFRHGRASGDYADLGSEVQIQDYLINTKV